MILCKLATRDLETSDRGQTSRDNKYMQNELRYRGLEVYKKSHKLVIIIYEITKSFPKEEIFGLISQIRRASVSIPANIVEGYGRNSKKDKVHFFFIARGSLNELEYYLDLSFELGYVQKEKYEELKNLRDEVGRLLNGFINSFADP